MTTWIEQQICKWHSQQRALIILKLLAGLIIFKQTLSQFYTFIDTGNHFFRSTQPEWYMILRHRINQWFQNEETILNHIYNLDTQICTFPLPRYQAYSNLLETD